MTITRQRWIMRELSPGTFKRFTTVDKEITWMMFSHFCFHYLNGILGHFFIAFCMFLFVTPRDLEEICQFGFCVEYDRKDLFSYTFAISVFFFQSLDCKERYWFPIFNYWLVAILLKKYNNNNSKAAVQLKMEKSVAIINVWIMHVAPALAFIAKSFLRITIF